MQDALEMGETDQVQLDGGAYGRIDAPYLWFCEFRDELLRQGCKQSPLDPCVFTYHEDGVLEGCLGIHVDDGIGGGSSKFMAMLKKVEARFKFGAFETGDFTYTGSVSNSGTTFRLNTIRLITLRSFLQFHWGRGDVMTRNP